MRRHAWNGLTIAALGLPLLGCMQTSRVSDDITPAALSQSKKAVAVMRIGSASPTCLHAAVMLGQREQTWFKTHQHIVVANIRSVTDPAVAEVELDPGEYHVVAYSCRDAKTAHAISDKGASRQFYRSSYASFTLAPGEIVNVGYLHFEASHVGRNAIGRKLKTDVEVTDWPLAELDQFKARRPTIYAQMTTRLMTLTPSAPVKPGTEECERMKVLQAEGKMQQLPAACAPGETNATRTARK